jgi:hypothetical protein
MVLSTRRSKPTCFASGLEGAGACDGQLVKAHLIPRQLIKRELARGLSTRELAELCWDARVWVPMCGGPMGNAGHHGALDFARTLRIPRALLPVGVEEFALEHGLEWWLDREYGPKEVGVDGC